MAKNRKLSRKELKKDDEFVTTGQEIVDRLSKYAMQIIAGVSVLILIIIAVVAVNLNSAKKAAEGAYAMGIALEIAERPVFEMDDDVDLGDDAFSSESRKRDAFRAALEKVREEHPRTASAALAAVYLGKIASEEERYDDALSFFGLFLREAPSGHTMKFAAYEGMGAIHEAMENLEEALDAYIKLERESEFYRPFGLLHQARILHELGRTDEAREKASLIVDEYTESPATRLARDLLARLPAVEEAS